MQADHAYKLAVSRECRVEYLAQTTAMAAVSPS
jgi:hypothetical protein